MPYPYTALWTFDDAPVLAATTRVDSDLLNIIRFENSTSDAGGKLSFPSYIDLAGMPGHPMPFRGSKVFKVDTLANTTIARIRDTEFVPTTQDTETVTVRLALYIDPSLNKGGAADDTIEFLQFSSAGANELELGVIDRAGDAGGDYAITTRDGAGGTDIETPVQAGQWVMIEVVFAVHSGGGTADIFVDGIAGAQLALTGLTLTQMNLGAPRMTDWGAGTGYLLFDQFGIDVRANASAKRIDRPKDRFPQTMHVITNQHVFVGPGWIEDLTLVGGQTADNFLRVYDTNIVDAGVLNEDDIRIELRVTSSTNGEIINASQAPIYFRHGAYLAFSDSSGESTSSGFGPRAIVKLGKCIGYGSDGAIRTVGRQGFRGIG